MIEATDKISERRTNIAVLAISGLEYSPHRFFTDAKSWNRSRAESDIRLRTHDYGNCVGGAVPLICL